MRRKPKGLVLCAQEKSILKGLLFNWMQDNKNLVSSNKVIRREYAYMAKMYSKLIHKKRCSHCGNWTI